MLTISASTQRYYRRKAEQVLDIAIAPGNSPICLPRGYISVPIICWFAEASWFREVPYKTSTRDSIWPGQAPMRWNLPVLRWWISLSCTFPGTSAGATADQNLPSTEEGWALKKVRNSVNLSENVRNYLWEVFLLGEEAGTTRLTLEMWQCVWKGCGTVAGRRDSRSDSANQELIISKKVIFSTGQYYYNRKSAKWSTTSGQI